MVLKITATKQTFKALEGNRRARGEEGRPAVYVRSSKMKNLQNRNVELHVKQQSGWFVGKRSSRFIRMGLDEVFLLK